jgi:hypothetical protein
MRVLLATLAVAGAIAAGCVPARAQVMTDGCNSVAMMSASDVIRALRCAPPFGCKRRRSKPQRANAPFRPGGGLAAALELDLNRTKTRKAAQADREGTLAQARDALTRDRSKRAAIIARLDQLGIAF